MQRGGKKSKRRMTITFFVTASGSKEKPVVIWKSKNPTCIQRFDKSALPVTYLDQKHAWMTGEILEEILSKLNRRLSVSNRFILLLLDNAGCHPVVRGRWPDRCADQSDLECWPQCSQEVRGLRPIHHVHVCS